MYTNNLNLTTNNTKIDQVCKVLVIDCESQTHVFQQIKKSRSNYKTMHVPVIILIKKYDAHIIRRLIEAGIDDYLVKPINPDELEIRIRLAIARAQRNQILNPLTKLPGNSLINKTITQRLAQPLALLFIDLDNFKAYNDYYGYNRGDNLLHSTAQLLVSTVSALGDDNHFIGHIGGDDFIIISTPEKDDALAQTICSQFDANVPLFYNEADFKAGKIITHNRQGKPQEFPLISLSIAIVHNELGTLNSLAHVAQLAAELKGYAKSKPNGAHGSNYVKDRRRK